MKIPCFSSKLGVTWVLGSHKTPEEAKAIAKCPESLLAASGSTSQGSGGAEKAEEMIGFHPQALGRAYRT